MPQFTYHNYHQMQSFLQEHASKYASITKLKSIGTSRLGKAIYSLVITAEASQENPLLPRVGLIGSLQGTDITGKELLLKLIEFLCGAYEQRDERITSLLQTTVIHIVPALDVDGNENATKGDCEGHLLPRDDLSTSFYFDQSNKEKGSMPTSNAEVSLESPTSPIALHIIGCCISRVTFYAIALVNLSHTWPWVWPYWWLSSSVTCYAH